MDHFIKQHKSTRGDRIFLIFNNFFLVTVLIIVLYPLVLILSSSLSSINAVVSGRVWLLPVEPTLEGYVSVFKNKNIITGYRNSLFYAVVGTSINIFLTILAAYPLSRSDFKLGKYIMFIFTFTMFFSGGLIPTYILVRKLGLYNNVWAMLIPGALSVWNVIITRTFFRTNIPKEFNEAAQIDGCDDINFLFRIVLPLSKAILAVNILFYAVGHWNEFFNAFIYLNNRKLYPLQLILREILIILDFDASMLPVHDLEERDIKIGLAELVRYSSIVVASLPVMIMYPFVQKYFVKGVMVGGLKG